MSSREPMWFCHECNAEMRPLMVPDPHCASCNGTFVEKMEDPSDDPREFQHHSPGHFEPDHDPPGVDNFLLNLQTLMRGDTRPSNPNQTFDRRNPGSGLRLEIRSSGPGTRTMVIGGPNTLGSRSVAGGPRGNTPGVRSGSGDVPTMSEFLDPMPGPMRDGTTITGPMMAQYLMALLGSRSGDPLAGLLGMGGQHGRMGDYVFNQEALDEIITSLMENGNSTRPVAASQEIIEDLPREVLEVGSPTLEKDCAVCKDQFKLETEDPDEQVVISLPCTHTFHESCIIPWLKSSGTCPVCRHALVPQPEHHPSGPDLGSGPSGSGRRASSVPPRRPGSPGAPSSQDAGSVFGSIFSNASGGNSVPRESGSMSQGNSANNRAPRQARWSSNTSRNRNYNFPGSWSEQLD